MTTPTLPSGHPAAEYVVYACDDCWRRIFTEKSNVGRKGKCPCCGVSHMVGGTSTAEEGSERRRAPRVKSSTTQVTVKGKEMVDGLSAEAILPLGDLSETGLSFKVPGIRDPKLLTGVAPPPLKEGDVIQVSLYSPKHFEAHTYKAKVKRIVQGELPDDDIFTVGCRFTGLTPRTKGELRAIVHWLLDGSDQADPLPEK